MEAEGNEAYEQPENADRSEQEPQAGSLVPFYGIPGIAPGIQAFRRGNVILYTVRGEPQEVLKLMGQLDEQGVGEVVALISHEAQEEPPEQGVAQEEE
jgi:hypothetical protein